MKTVPLELTGSEVCTTRWERRRPAGFCGFVPLGRRAGATPALLPAVGPGQYDEQGRSIIEVGKHSAAMLEELEKAHIYIAQLNDELKEKVRSMSALAQRLERLEALLLAHESGR